MLHACWSVSVYFRDGRLGVFTEQELIFELINTTELGEPCPWCSHLSRGCCPWKLPCPKNQGPAEAELLNWNSGDPNPSSPSVFSWNPRMFWVQSPSPVPGCSNPHPGDTARAGAASASQGNLCQSCSMAAAEFRAGEAPALAVLGEIPPRNPSSFELGKQLLRHRAAPGCCYQNTKRAFHCRNVNTAPGRIKSFRAAGFQRSQKAVIQ